MVAYYNEHDAYAAAWLRNLIAEGLIAPGLVDERDIRDVRPSDLDGFVQCHFFAGIGVWSYALRLAGWPDERPIWTGSCPCQPFSAAGRGAGFADERHLWPSWCWLISQCRPDEILGEQVEAAVRLGWLDAVFSDLEGEGYACGTVVLGAHSVGAPHIRLRSWFVAHATDARQRDAEDTRADRRHSRSLQSGRQGQSWLRQPERGGDPGALGHAHSAGQRGCPQRDQRAEAGQQAPFRADAERSGFWSAADWIACRDGKARPVEPGTFPLAHGAPARVGRLRAYGNAINAGGSLHPRRRRRPARSRVCSTRRRVRMSGLEIDFETRSPVDLKTRGVYVYFEHPETVPLMASYRLNGGPVQRWRPPAPCPPDIVLHVKLGGTISAHNAGFERLLWMHVLTPRFGWPVVEIEQFRCTAATAAALSLPRDLERLGKALGLDQQKDKAGKKLIQLFSLPRKPRKDEQP